MLIEFGVRGNPLLSHSSDPCCWAQNVETPKHAEPRIELIFELSTSTVSRFSFHTRRGRDLEQISSDDVITHVELKPRWGKARRPRQERSWNLGPGKKTVDDSPRLVVKALPLNQ